MADPYHVEVHMKSGPDKVWQCIRYSATLFPSALPKEYKKIDVVKGDGNSADSIRIVHFADGWQITSAMEKILEVDDENKNLTYEVIGGDMCNYYKSFKATVEVIGKGTGSLVKWAAKPNKNANKIPDPNFPGNFITNTYNNLDAFLYGNN